MRVNGKGTLYIGENPELVKIGDASFEFKVDTSGFNLEFGRLRHFRTPEAAEASHSRNGGCITWCKCRTHLCSMRTGHGGPFHAFPEHTCNDRLRNGDPLEVLLDEAETDSPTYELGTYRKQGIEDELWRLPGIDD